MGETNEAAIRLLMNAKRTASVGPRGSGRTTVLANAAKAIGATVVAADSQSACRIAEEHSVKAVAVERMNAGCLGPFVWDHHAVFVALSQAAEVVQRLQLDLAAERVKVRRLERAAMSAQQSLSAP